MRLQRPRPWECEPPRHRSAPATDAETSGRLKGLLVRSGVSPHGFPNNQLEAKGKVANHLVARLVRKHEIAAVVGPLFFFGHQVFN